MNVGAYLHATARNVLWKQLRDSHEVSDGDIETTVGADDDLDNDPNGRRSSASSRAWCGAARPS